MNKMIPIGLFSTLLLTACGGSDSGGGSSTPAPTKYTWQFLQMVDTLPNGCNPSLATVFSATEANGVIKNTYAVEATDVKITISDINGHNQVYLDKSDISPSGQLILSEDQIPDGGYVSVVETDNLTGSVAYILSVQKEMLTDAFIKVNTNQGANSNCYTKNALKIDSNKKKVTIEYTPNDGISAVSAEDYFDGKSTPNSAPTINNLTVISPSEPVLLSGYTNDKNGVLDNITHYKYVESKTLATDAPASVSNNQTLLIIDGSSRIDVYPSSNAITTAFDKLTVKSLFNEHSFDWFAWDNENKNNTYEVSTPFGGEYSYSAQYHTVINGWDTLSNNVITNGLSDVNLANVNLSLDPVALTCISGVCEFDFADVTREKIQGASVDYTLQDGSFKMNHSVYAKGPIVTIPQIITSRYPDHTTPVNKSFISADQDNKKIIDIFTVFGKTKNFSSTAGKVEMLLPPALGLAHEELLIKNNYNIFTK